jgi:hypothetical protein
MIRVIGPRDNREVSAVNTTSSSNNWSKGLSPFILGPVTLYSGYTSKRVENAWQFCKVPAKYADRQGNPSPDYFKWAKAGWNDTYAHRYPMGKGERPLYSWWDGEKLDYVSARKKIYIPLYAGAVVKAPAFSLLAKRYETEGRITLFDFDGYDHLKLGMSLSDVVNDPTRKMGHAFVLAMILSGEDLSEFVK